MVQISYCYRNGDLDKALQEAEEFIRKIGERHVLHVIARRDENDAWWVDVIYTND